MMVASPRCVDVTVVVRAAALALVGLARRVGTQHTAVANPRRRSVGHQLAGVRNATEIDDRLLHRHFDALAFASELALIQRGQDANRGVQARPRVAYRRPRLEWPAVRLARRAQRTAN